jgi:CHAD domain-containing protein
MSVRRCSVGSGLSYDCDVSASADAIVDEAIDACARRWMEQLLTSLDQQRWEDQAEVAGTRVAARRLRYLVEAFRASVVEPKKWTESLRRLERPLGAIKDIDEVIAFVGRTDARLIAEHIALWSHDEVPGNDPRDVAAELVKARRSLVARMSEKRTRAVARLRSSGRPVISRLMRRIERSAPVRRTSIPAAAAVDALADQWRSVEGAVDELGRPATADELHRVRKNVRRLRTTTEIVAGTLGSRWADVAEAAGVIQDILGEHQDAVITHHLLLGAAWRSRWEAFEAGRLVAIRAADAVRAREAFPVAWERLAERWETALATPRLRRRYRPAT